MFLHLAKSLIFLYEANRDPNMPVYNDDINTCDMPSVNTIKGKTITLDKEDHIAQQHHAKSRCCSS